MSRKCEISFALSAVEDLEYIREWYSDQQVPEVGERLLREVVSQVERLADFPESGRIVPEFRVAHLREIVHPPFRIVYRLGRGRVRVVRVWRSERQLKIPEERAERGDRAKFERAMSKVQDVEPDEAGR